MKRETGFTLMEVLIAVAITAIIGVGVWQVMSGMINARDRVDDLAEQFEGLQKTMLLLERDITQVVNRPVRDIYGDYQFALSSRDPDYAVILTRQGWRNPLGIRRSELQRVAWEFTGDQLRRRYWLSVDQGQEDESQSNDLLSGVTDFRVRFMDKDRNWSDTWPKDEILTTLNPGARPELPLPLGIEIVLEHERFGELTRLFSLPTFDGEAAQNAVNQSALPDTESEDEVSEEEGASG